MLHESVARNAQPMPLNSVASLHQIYAFTHCMHRSLLFALNDTHCVLVYVMLSSNQHYEQDYELLETA